MYRSKSSGFTLIELSLVLVIAGLLIGGVLAGQAMIEASKVYSLVGQTNKYLMAVQDFKERYNQLPGDIADPAATAAGLLPRGNYDGSGNGDGVIKGFYGTPPNAGGGAVFGHPRSGEPSMFWVDLYASGAIDEPFTAAAPNVRIGSVPAAGRSLGQYMPKARIGGENYFSVWSGGYAKRWNDADHDGQNYLTVSVVRSFNGGGTDEIRGDTGLSPALAYGVDLKTDDGLPQSGKILAYYLNADSSAAGFTMVPWAHGGGVYGANCGTGCTPRNGPTTAATPPDPLNCFDNNGVVGPQQYAVANSAKNCALSTRF